MIKKPTVIFLMDMFAYTLMLYFSIISSKKKRARKKTQNLKLQSFTKVGYCVYFSKK